MRIKLCFVDVMFSQCGHFSLHAPRFNGRNCGFPASTPALSQFDSLMSAPTTGDDEQQIRIEELLRQSSLTPPLQWESTVEIYITLNNMVDL